MCRRTPGVDICVHDASSATPMSSILLATGVPPTVGVMAIAITFSVHSGSSLAKGSQSGFQLPLACFRVGAFFALEKPAMIADLLLFCMVTLPELGVRGSVQVRRPRHSSNQ